MLLRAVLLLLTGLLAAQEQPLVIRDTTVIDATGRPPRKGVDVLVASGRIRAVAPGLKAPAGARVVNGRGKYVIPGLWDMHVRLRHYPNLLATYVRYGVVGVRDMGSDWSRTAPLAAQVKADRLLGPNIITTGTALDSESSPERNVPVTIIRTPNDARRAIDYLEKQKVDQISLRPTLTQAAYKAIGTWARTIYVPFAGALPNEVGLRDAIDARQKSIDGVESAQLYIGCSTREPYFRSYSGVPAADVLDSYNSAKARDVFIHARRMDTSFVPMLSAAQRHWGTNIARLRESVAEELLPKAVREDWPPVTAVNTGPSEQALRRYTMAEKAVFDMKSAGARLMAGTGTGDAHAVPGRELHEELRLLVQAGLTPLEALQAATRNVAEFMLAASQFGTVEPGKRADLVILDENPLENIENVGKIDAVVLRGRYYPRRQLEAMAKP